MDEKMLKKAIFMSTWLTAETILSPGWTEAGPDFTFQMDYPNFFFKLAVQAYLMR
jgi:hypothetical protein